MFSGTFCRELCNNVEDLYTRGGAINHNSNLSLVKDVVVQAYVLKIWVARNNMFSISSQLPMTSNLLRYIISIIGVLSVGVLGGWIGLVTRKSLCLFNYGLAFASLGFF